MTVTMRSLSQKLRDILQTPPKDGLSPIAPFGAVFCITRHRLHSITPLRPTAVLILAGTKVLLRGEESLTLPAGEMFLLPEGFTIGVENIPDPATGRFLSFCLSMDEELLAKVAAHRDETPPAPFSIASLRVTVDAPLRLSLAHLLDMAEACPGHERLLRTCMEEVLLLAAERTDCLPFVWNAAASASARCTRLISMDPGRAWSAAEVASRLGASERSLRRSLSAEGQGFRAILQTVRLNAALALLQAGRISVGEAAAQCGYDSASRFAGLFRERFGASPSEVLRCNAVSGQ